MCLNTAESSEKPVNIYEKIISCIGRHESFIITTHDPADADGLGAEFILACILRQQGKEVRIINASPTPKQFQFMDPQGLVEQWDEEKHGTLPEQTAAFMVDTADIHNIGQMRDAICRAREVAILDHHEALSNSPFTGISDSSAASASELAVELATVMNITIDKQAAFAAYIGIAYDTGFFAYPKTGPRTFRAALILLDLGVKPYDVYRHLNENVSAVALLLQKRALSSLTLHCENRVAAQVLYLHDFTETGAGSDDTDGFVNFPLKSRDIVVSIMVKEAVEGRVRCSLRSKEGTVDVARIAREFGGGGHINAAGLKSNVSVDITLTLVLAKIAESMEKL